MTRVPWDFSEAPSDEDAAVPNLPTPEGRLLGAELARLADIEEEHLRERFPHAHRRCGECAFRAGTDPNGCVETLMDAVKALVEGVPFYCHKKFDEDGKPVLLCAGFALLAGTSLTTDEMNPSKCGPSEHAEREAVGPTNPRPEGGES